MNHLILPTTVSPTQNTEAPVNLTHDIISEQTKPTSTVNFFEKRTKKRNLSPILIRQPYEQDKLRHFGSQSCKERKEATNTLIQKKQKSKVVVKKAKK